MAALVFFVLTAILKGLILLLNKFTISDIVLQLHWGDVLVGLTIYLKTSVDFAIIIGNLMARYGGMKNRIAIEIGTAVGNASGTLIVLTLWNFFRDIEWLLALMIFIAALVLFKLAEEGLTHAKEGNATVAPVIRTFTRRFEYILKKFNSLVEPFLKYVIPHAGMKPAANLTFMGLFAASFTIPFILGLDDFAGYVPLFSIVNVFGFAVGVFLGHMLLNMALFIAPDKTIKAVKNPIISLTGSVVFVGLGLWGLYEVGKIIFSVH